MNGEKNIAVFELQIIQENIIEIKNIAVEEKYQGEGIGKFLLRDASKRAKKRGFTTVILGTGAASTKQMCLYQKENFEVFDVKKTFTLIIIQNPFMRMEYN